MLADADFITNKLAACDRVALIGFPAGVWDVKNNLPILRSGVISSDPRLDYNNQLSSAGHVIGYEAFSTGGASGSPVFALQKGFQIDGDLNISDEFYRETRLIGINAASVHMGDGHQQMSLMYKANYIMDLIDACEEKKDTTEEELLLLHFRYPEVHFLLFSEQLSRDFLRRMLLSNRMFSVVLKDSPLHEIVDALESLRKGRQYICTDVQMLIDTPERQSDRSPLTKTERDILKLMAVGKKSRQIAEERFLSVHTVVTHRKNIFRKLNVNNAQEAIRYALRAGIVDPLEYYI